MLLLLWEEILLTSEKQRSGLDDRLAKYGSMAIAAAAVAVAPHAQAGMEIINPGSPVALNPAVYIDLAGQTIQNQAINQPPIKIYTSSLGAAGGGLIAGAAAGVGLLNGGAPLSPGARIGNGGKFLIGPTFTYLLNSYKGNAGGPWAGVPRGYLGVEFVVNNQIDYGWVDLSITSFNSGSVNCAGFDPSGAAVTAGEGVALGTCSAVSTGSTDAGVPGAATPEPASIALMALGAAGLAAIRRRRINRG